MKRNKNGQFRSYITESQWKAFMIGVLVIWSVFWLGYLVGYRVAIRSVFVSPVPETKPTAPIDMKTINDAIQKGWLKLERN